MGDRDRTYEILVINPGSTSTKIAMFDNEIERVSRSIQHSSEEFAALAGVSLQAPSRLEKIRHFLEENGITRLDAIAARGGFLRPVPSGVYRVTPAMLEDLSSARYGEHASNLGAMIASDLAKRFACEAFIADPVVVDEMMDAARFSGIPEIERRSVFHALNHKSSARHVAEKLGKPYEDCALIVAHLGGGVSVGAHDHGKVIDVNNALNGDGPFSPERSGGLPIWQTLELVRSGGFSWDQMKKRIVGKGGLVAYLGTNDLRELTRRIDDGDPLAGRVFDAMVHQIAKEIASHGATLKGRVDAIVLTGGMACNQRLVGAIGERVGFLAPIMVVPGEREMESLAENILGVLRRQRQIQEY